MQPSIDLIVAEVVDEQDHCGGQCDERGHCRSARGPAGWLDSSAPARALRIRILSEGGLSVLTEILGLGWCGTCRCCIEELAEEED
jgi:hypothetical protein